MIEHLKLFPTVTSHYSRLSTSKLYFTNSLLTIKKLFKLFKAYYQEKAKVELDIGYKIYYKYFKRSLPNKYSFRRPRIDVCDFCTEYKLKIKADPANTGYQHSLQKHDQKVSQYKALKKHITSKKEVNLACVFEFDYAQNLPLPKLNNTSVFYKRLLSMYVFNIHSHHDGDSIFYTYLECDGAKNGNSVCSFLYTFITEKLSCPDFERKMEIVLLSDACGGQNKNLTVSKFLSIMAKIWNIEIEQIFSVRGHSYCQYDRNFGSYGRIVKKHADISHFKKYLQIMMEARETKPFKVCHNPSIIKDITEITKSMTICETQKPRKTDVFPIQKFVRISYTRNGTIFASETYIAKYKKYIVQNMPSNFDFSGLTSPQPVK